MAYSSIELTSADGIALLTFNRPKALNALNSSLLEELSTALDSISQDETIRVLILTGAGEKSFIAGADITEIATLTPLGAKKFAQFGQSIISKLQGLAIPVIAAVNGFALGGGCEMALACDFIYASEKAIFGLPEITLGVIPGFGGTQRLPRLVGTNKALEMNLVGDAIGAEEAYDFGLVNRTVVDHELLDTALAWGRKLAEQAPIAVEQIKRVSGAGDLDEGIEAEKAGFAAAFGSEDGTEGISAFLGKRKPQWKGR